MERCGDLFESGGDVPRAEVGPARHCAGGAVPTLWMGWELEGGSFLEAEDRKLFPAGASVPAGVEHRPVAKEEAHLLLIEPKGTPNTGDASTAAKTEML